MCSVVGILANTFVNQDIYDALIALQHRGQDAAGMVTCDEGRLFTHKSKGLVRDVFQERDMRHLNGNMGIGHVRYPTAGGHGDDEAQPFYVNSPYGITLSHNGNLTNAAQLKQDLFQTDLRHLNTDSDSEILLNIFAHELQKLRKIELTPEDIFTAVSGVHKRCKGAYAVVTMITDYGLVAFRDPFGIRPLVYGKRNDNEYMIASESVGLDAVGFSLIDSVRPGEAVIITKDGMVHKKQCADNPTLSTCLFELVYLARPDSIIDKILVYKVRLRLGDYLADKIMREHPDHDIDVVMPIPDTSRTAASTLARRLEVKYREGFVKNRYIGRTFIMTGQSQRRRTVRQKLNAIPLEFKNKNVLLVDDSIVRGTTSKEIIKMARDAGAKNVYFASAAPAVKYPNVYGIDIPSTQGLIANNRTTDEVAKLIGADWLVYQDLQVLIDAAHEGNPEVERFEDSVFTGNYVTGEVDKQYLERLEVERAE